jgi:flagellar biosynthesis/type III secretory pathway chaperone
MFDLVNQLIAALREELQHYGEMLALLDAQQDFVLERSTQSLLESVTAVDAQGRAIQHARELRAQRQRAVAKDLGLPSDAHFSHILPLLPPDYQPLVNALVSENNELLVRVQQRVRQNHLLLTRSVELMQRFLSSFFAPSAPATYSEAGLNNRAPAQALYEAVG